MFARFCAWRGGVWGERSDSNLGDVRMRDEFKVTQLVDELGNFISKWPWQIWATLTFRSSFRISNQKLKSHWDKLISVIGKLQGTEPYWVRSVEVGREQTVQHLHALFGNIDLPAREIPRLWHPGTGNARAEAYDPERRAAWYIAKNPEAVEFSPNLPPPATD